MKLSVEPQFAALRPFLESLPHQFRLPDAGRVIYRGRNELRAFTLAGVGEVVVKAFCTPNIINRLAYGLVRPSKAERSCLWALRLRALGINSPEPVGWVEVRHGLLLADSYYVSRRSTLPYTYIDLVEQRVPDCEAQPLLREVGRTAARMHEAGLLHRDFSRGNLLLGLVDGRPRCELIDLNRIRRRRVSLSDGMANLSRLPATDAMKRLIAEGYAEVRHADPALCLRLYPETEKP